MNYNIHIENLGAIKEADIIITPLTVLAGENGTGKSFVTKFLYSVLNIINVDTYSNHTLNILNSLRSNFSQIVEFLVEAKSNNNVSDDINYTDYLQTIESLRSNISALSEYIKTTETDYYSLENDFIENFHNDIAIYKETILPKLVALENKLDKKIDEDSSRIFLNIFNPFNRTKRFLKKSLDNLNEITKTLNNPKVSYLNVLSEYITNELKENFQVSDIKSLIKSSAKSCTFIIEDLITVSISKDDGLSVELESEYLPSFERTKHILFFESPVYWRLLPIIDNLDDMWSPSSSQPEILTGIPKHFFDLKKLIFTNFKEGERPPFIEECADDLKAHLRGHFKQSDSDLTFENAEGENIPKNLVSFGMTNIGIIQAVLSKNIINKGSFVFIDEPESNLHPEWQSVLSEVLVRLASHEVNIVITTHSSDMMKSLEFYTNQIEQDNSISRFISSQYFSNNGTLLDLYGNTPLDKLASARVELLKAYNKVSKKRNPFGE